MKSMRQNNRSRGLTLVELLVVLAVLSLLAAIAIPAIATLGNFMRTDLQSTSQELHSMLRAARIYATTHRVETAVAYSLDSYDAPSIGVADNVTGQTVRVITAAAMLYQKGGAWGPVPGDDGDFRSFRGGTVIPLLNLDPNAGADYLTPLYSDTSTYNFDLVLGLELLRQYGMKHVELRLDDGAVATFPAHSFNARGNLVPDTAFKERYEFWLTPSPDSSRNERLIQSERNSYLQTDGTPNLLRIPIELYRSTGKVKIIND